MASGLSGGSTGLTVGTGLYKSVSGLWSGLSGLLADFLGGGTPPVTPPSLLLEDGFYLLLEDGSYILLE